MKKRAHTDQIDDAAAWLAKRAPDLVKSVTRELRAPRLDTGESATSQSQASQQYSKERQVVLSVQRLRLEELSTDVDGSAVSGAGLGGDDEEGAKGPGLAGKWRQAHIRGLWDAPEGADPEAVRGVSKIVEDLPPSQQETFQLIYVERLSETEAAQRLGCSRQAVHNRVVRLRSAVERAGAFPPAP